ncbi:hypothetical protein DIPPA_12846 [Diplonema papillatum]|nr:hypothetical protein DIPPA_12846 [Diplonema papillatum]|eukprot:gene7614-11662_t
MTGVRQFRALVAGVLLSVASTEGAYYTASHSSVTLASPITLTIPAQECAVVNVQLSAGSYLQMDYSGDNGFEPQILTSINKRRDGGCWVAPDAHDTYGIQAACDVCSVLFSGRAVEDVCYTTSESLYIEVFNPTASEGKFSYSNAKVEQHATTTDCDNPFNPPSLCTAADVPSCAAWGNGTGGSLVGDPGKGTCECQCLSGWFPPDCDSDRAPTAAPPSTAPQTAAPATATPAKATLIPSTTSPSAASTQAPSAATTSAPPITPATSSPGGSPSPGLPQPVKAAADEGDGSSGMWIVGAILGALALLVALCVAAYVVVGKQRKKEADDKCRSLMAADVQPGEPPAEMQRAQAVPYFSSPMRMGQLPTFGSDSLIKRVVLTEPVDADDDVYTASSSFSAGRCSIGSEHEMFGDDYFPL